MSGELAAALRDLRIDSPDVEAIRDRLYAHGFARGPGDRLGSSNATESELAQRLSDANQSRDRWDDGWRIERLDPSGAILATRGSLRRTAQPGEYAPTFSNTLRPAISMAATLLLPRESLTLQAHVYYAFGEALPQHDDEERPVRIYWHAPEEALPALYARLSAELNGQQLPFTLKTMLAAHERDRRDATVLYVPRRCWSAVERLIASLPASLLARLAPGVPLFTRELAPGVGMAESPGGGESFGMHRCRLVAEGIGDAWRSGRHDVEARLAAVERRFRSAGVDWEQPHRSEWPRVTDHSSRNHNLALARADGSGQFVKRLRVQGAESLRMMEREAAVYRYGLGELAPAFIRFDREEQTLVCELVANAQSLARVQAPRFPVEIAAAAAASLRALHRLRIDDPLLDTLPPGIYDAHRGGPLRQWLGPGQMALIDAVRTHPVLSPALDAMAAAWRRQRLIHGDVKWENCLWTADGEIKWVDWELAALGDPCWDAGCFVESYLSHAVWTATPLEAMLPALRVFLRDYGADDEPLLRCAAARLVQRALEVMQGQPRPTPLALALFEESARLMAEPRLEL